MPALVGRLVDRRFGHGATDRDHACVIDADIESSPELECRPHEFVGYSHVHQVADDAYRSRAEGRQLGRTIVDSIRG